MAVTKDSYWVVKVCKRTALPPITRIRLLNRTVALVSDCRAQISFEERNIYSRIGLL